jgi:hypothetical protein
MVRNAHDQTLTMSLNSRISRLEARAANEDSRSRCRLLLPCKEGDGNPPGSCLLIEYPSGRDRVIRREARHLYPDLFPVAEAIMFNDHVVAEIGDDGRGIPPDGLSIYPGATFERIENPGDQ